MASNATYYWPNGTPTVGFESRNSTANGAVSACCDFTSSICTASSVCVGLHGNYYRGACTDPSWRSPSCGSQCVDGLYFLSSVIDSNLSPVHPEDLNNIVPCIAGVYDSSSSHCCYILDRQFCSKTSFSLDYGFPLHTCQTEHQL